MKKLLVLATLLLLLCTTAFGAGLNDTENHIDYNNDQVEIPRKKKNLTTDDFWIRDEKNLITNFYSMYCPEVVYMPEKDNGTDYPYFMYFFAWAYTQENDPIPGEYEGFKGGDAIFMARAKQLEGPWEIYMGDDKWDTTMSPKLWVPVIVATDTPDSNWHVGDPSVVYKDGIFYMAFSGMGTDLDGIPSHKPGDTDGNTSCIKLATSTDGIHWDISEEPILIWENEIGHDDRNSSSYYGGYQRPSLMYEDGIWKCWFDYAASSHGQRVGYAENRGDIFNPNDWKRINVLTKEDDWKEFGTKTIMGVDFEVIKIGSTYYAYGDPYLDWFGIRDDKLPKLSSAIDPSGWSRRQIVEYQSKDGLNWKVTGYFLPDTGYDASQIPQPFIDHKNQRVCIFYATQRGTKYSKTSYDWRWDNIRFMYKSLSDFESNTTDPERTPYPYVEPTPTPIYRPTQTPVPSNEPIVITKAPAGTDQQPQATPTVATTPEPTQGGGGNAALWIGIAAAVVGAGFIAAAFVLLKKKKSE